MPLSIFGIRHHGPGCARSLRAALDELQPDVLVIEGPADAEGAIAMAAHAERKPPVALLVYPPDEPSRAVYYPFAEYSPEWQAIRWALDHGVPVRLMDLPQSLQMVMDARAEENAKETASRAETQSEAPSDPSTDEDGSQWKTDPLALLAEAAGYKDHELWWEQQVERRENATGLFEAILEAMRTLRDEFEERRDRDLLREAHMRKTLRGVLRDGHQRIAAICGAWHAPALDEDALSGRRQGLTAKDDEARLKGLAKRKTSATWIPWTFTRLTYRSGYGAGVDSPGWYAHLWQSPEQAAVRWVATAARLLREKDLDASSASVIEAVRLADALAAIRQLRSPGLAELTESILTVLCHGDQAPLRLIRRRLEIGDVLGQVPSDAESTPLARNVADLQRKLRLPPSSEIRHLDLDVRKENDLARSHLLHRLGLLGIPWGLFQQSGGRASTFHEIWRIEWKPEFAVAIIEANVWGNTVEAAATAKVVHDADEANSLPQIASLFDTSILAGLHRGIEPLLARIQAQSAVAADVRHLMDALAPLARVVRYGDVRGTQATQVLPILVGMFERAVVGLRAACSSLDEEAAHRMLESLEHVQQALDILNRDDLHAEWRTGVRSLMEADIHALLRGWSCRLLLEKGCLEEDQLLRAARLALSPANPPAACAAWATGLLKGSGLLLLHQDGVWRVFDRWLSGLHGDTFVEMLPLLRRAFADFTHAERRQMGEKARHLGRDARDPTGSSGSATTTDVHFDRAKLALPVLAQILGVAHDGDHQ